VDRASILAALDLDLTDADVKRVLGAARLDASSAWPSIETFFHAALYELTGAQFIGHTHPEAVCAMVCSQRAEDITRHVMPDVIIVCGLHSVFVPYTDPGLALCREIITRTKAFIAQHRQQPRTIYLQNHGLIALGQSAREVKNITAMAVKHARVLAATYSLGGPMFLDEWANARIEMRPDEDVRRAQFK
jgi:rhamnose utilization protein RhaD (predicted bifunctional aldolase and dehydrogenase)